LAKRRDYLAQANAPIVGRDTLMPIRTKSLVLQTLDGTLQQVFILKAPSRQKDAFGDAISSHLNHCFDQTVVKAR
jgi:hypothetical protein